MPGLPFKALFCQKFGCPPEEYDERAFKKFLYFHARIFAPIIRLVKPAYFADDLEFIRYLGESMDSRQAKSDVLDFRDSESKNWRLLHTAFMIRVSHRKARRLACQLLGKPEWTGPGLPD